VVVDAINRVLCKKDDFLQTLRANIATVVLQGDALSPEVIDERLNKLQKELLKKVSLPPSQSLMMMRRWSAARLRRLPFLRTASP